MPLVLIAPTCVELSDWISVVVKAWMTVAGNKLICAAERLEIPIRPTNRLCYLR
jgi:hypothetical protein